MYFLINVTSWLKKFTGYDWLYFRLQGRCVIIAEVYFSAESYFIFTKYLKRSHRNILKNDITGTRPPPY